MYGDQSEIHIKLPYPQKAATLRLPTQAEGTAYLDAINKKGQESKPDIDLFTKIRLDKDGESFDGYECEFVISNLTTNKVVSCDKSGDEFTVVLHTHFGEVTHTLRPPTLKEMSVYRSAVMSNENKAGTKAASKLYDALMQSTDGYADNYDVPIFHRVTVVSAVYIALSNIDPIQIDPLA